MKSTMISSVYAKFVLKEYEPRRHHKGCALTKCCRRGGRQVVGSHRKDGRETHVMTRRFSGTKSWAVAFEKFDSNRTEEASTLRYVV